MASPPLARWIHVQKLHAEKQQINFLSAGNHANHIHSDLILTWNKFKPWLQFTARTTPIIIVAVKPMKRKQDIEGNGDSVEKHSKKQQKKSKLSDVHLSLSTSSYYNKNRGTLRIKDNSLKCFFAEFVSVAKTPLHFYVVKKSIEQTKTVESKFKIISHSFVRMIACFLIRHRYVVFLFL